MLHVSTATGFDLIKWARTQGVDVTDEVMPHHLVMTDEWVAGDRALRNTDLRGADAPAAASGHEGQSTTSDRRGHRGPS